MGELLGKGGVPQAIHHSPQLTITKPDLRSQFFLLHNARLPSLHKSFEANVGWCSVVAMFVEHGWLAIGTNDRGGGIRSPQIDGALQHHGYHKGEMVQMTLTCNGRWH